MKLNKEKQCFVIFGLSFLFLFVSYANAQNLQEIKARMLDRKSTIETLKTQGLVGEGSDGYLHMRKASAGAKKAVNEENADRRTVNGIIANKEGTTVEQVSKKVALKLMKVASPGHWLQKADGTWYQK